MISFGIRREREEMVYDSAPFDLRAAARVYKCADARLMWKNVRGVHLSPSGKRLNRAISEDYSVRSCAMYGVASRSLSRV